MDIVDQLNDWAIFGIIFVTIFFVLGIAETIRNYTGTVSDTHLTLPTKA